MKSKENQGFSTFDFFTMTASLALIAVISGPIIKKNMEVGNIDKAQREARNLAFDLLHDEKFQKLRVASFSSLQQNHQNRGIASVEEKTTWSGETGQDPWGNPYHFRFLRNNKGMPIEIVVWSQGPDKQSGNEIKVSHSNGSEQLELSPDDIVAQVPLR